MEADNKKIFLKQDIPHHFYELQVKKIARVYFGDTTSPEKCVYKRLKDNWNKVAETIYTENLCLFDWRKC